MKWIIILIVLLAMAAPAMAQVDNLWLHQLNVINTSENGITYVQDLQGDSTSEIIFSGYHYIKIFNGITGDTIWSSPYLVYNNLNENVQFYDLNSDGDLDIAFIDSSNLLVFDPVHDQLIWTSPVLPQWRNSCFGFGDVNSDGYTDIIISKPEPFRSDIAPDTTWIEYYLAPDFHLGGSSILLFTAWGSHSSGEFRLENIKKILTGTISSPQGPVDKLILLTTVSHEAHWAHLCGEGWGTVIHLYEGNGNIRFMDFDNFNNVVEIDSVGNLISLSKVDTSMYLITEKYSITYDLCPGWADPPIRNYFRTTISGSNLQDFDEIGSTTNGWKGYTIGEFNPVNVGEEIFYKDNETIHLNSYPALDPIWIGTTNFDEANQFLGPYHSALFTNPQIMLVSSTSRPSQLYDCIAGIQSAAVLPACSFGKSFMVDLDNDSEIEIVRTYNNNQIFVYHLLEYPDGINDAPNPLPSSFLLHPNYPNPFNASTIISYELPTPSDVKLDIYDIQGRKVATLVDDAQQAGNHEIVWDGSQYSSGIYFYRLKAGDFTQTKRMTLLK